jgi:HEAT repeat protein
MKAPGLWTILGTILCLFTVCQTDSIAADSNPTTAYVSTADNQWVLWLPMDSKAAIDAAIDTAARDYHVTRLWWRGSQDELFINHLKIRPANRFFDAMWAWTQQCIEQRGTNRAAVEAARRNHMSIYAVWGIYEYMSSGDAGACIQYPYQGEDELRIQHPEWIPVNKYGTRLQNGPLEFAYPECRKAVVDRLADYLEASDYDGICLYTYNENFTLRYPDEFGYSQPIVDEFKKRYGIDIRTQPFDKDAWARLRGEYFTSLLVELKARLANHQKKVVIWLSANDTHLPMTWHSGGDGATRTAGHIYMDWEEWVKQGAIDELCVYWPGDDDSLKNVLAACKGTPVQVSMFRTLGDLPAGVIRVIGPGGEMESGYPREANIGWPSERLAVEPIESIKDGSALAKRRALYCVAQGKENAPLEDLIAATKGSDVYVRRAALRALAKSKDPLAQAAEEAALHDSENCVQCQAAVLLGDFGDPRAIDPIFDAVRNGATFQFDYVAAISALTALGPKNIDAVVKRTEDSNPNVRRVALQALEAIPASSFPSARDVLMRVAANDSEPWIREMALGALARYRFDPQVVQLMTRALSDADETVQVRAASYLTWLVFTSQVTPFNPKAGESAVTLPDTGLPSDARLDEPSRFDLSDAGSPKRAMQEKALHDLLALFKQYGDGCQRSDADWGWRPIGNSVLCYGDVGRAELQKIIDADQDKRLAELSWRVVYLPQRVMAYVRCTEQVDAEAQRHRPSHMLSAPSPAAP